MALTHIAQGKLIWNHREIFIIMFFERFLLLGRYDSKYHIGKFSLEETFHFESISESANL